jgi:hypothetical protein
MSERPAMSKASMIDVDGVIRHRFNSNGGLIHSTEQGIKNFWRWFDSSVTTDEQGRPLVLYHGTDKAFGEFNNQINRTDAPWSRLGHFFTQDASLASSFTKGKKWSSSKSRHPKGANVIPVYLKLSNPSMEKAYKLLPMSSVQFAAELAQYDSLESVREEVAALVLALSKWDFEITQGKQEIINAMFAVRDEINQLFDGFISATQALIASATPEEDSADFSLLRYEPLKAASDVWHSYMSHDALNKKLCHNIHPAYVAEIF